MSVIQTLQNLLGNARIRPTSAGISKIRTALAVEQTASADYRNARTHLLRLYNALEKLAASGTKLVITVDCGIASLEPARNAERLGIELIVTDHHAVADELPGATARP